MRTVMCAALLAVAAAAWGQGYESLKWGATVEEVRKAYPGLRAADKDDISRLAEEAKAFGIMRKDILAYTQEPQKEVAGRKRYFFFWKSILTWVIDDMGTVTDAEAMLRLSDEAVNKAIEHYKAGEVIFRDTRKEVRGLREWHTYNVDIVVGERTALPVVSVWIKMCYIINRDTLSHKINAVPQDIFYGGSVIIQHSGNNQF